MSPAVKQRLERFQVECPAGRYFANAPTKEAARGMVYKRVLGEQAKKAKTNGMVAQVISCDELVDVSLALDIPPYLASIDTFGQAADIKFAPRG